MEAGEPENPDEPIPVPVMERIGRVFAIPLLLGIGVGVVLLIEGADPGKTTPKANPGFLDLVFSNRTVLIFVRVALIAAAIYLLISVIALVVRGRWLIRAGPFQASDQDIRELKEAAEYWQAEAFSQAQQVQELTQRVEETDQLVETLIAALPDEPDPGSGATP